LTSTLVDPPPGDRELGLLSIGELSRDEANLKTPGFRPAPRRSEQASRTKRSRCDNYGGALTDTRNDR